ncbi:hypothetical protein [Mesorhizobium escarrei]|uniref:Uncharacterized protein n=1 Tax=Mesorhizobium escarrei TaxID=666018 RepID=A0ABM9DTU2_9HYPH|nr:hypothetical protein [Mesorhizobium escarrei]CAH2399595.1 conserved hypothetical protein [Mesorhizobium escarrei]
MRYKLWQSNSSEQAIRVTFYLDDDDGEVTAMVERTGPVREGEDYSWYPFGEPTRMLDEASSIATKMGLDVVYIKLEGVDWNPEWGPLPE